MLAPSPSRDPLPVVRKPIADAIIEAAAEFGGCTVADLKGPQRHRRYAYPRQAAMAVMRSLAVGPFHGGAWSLPAIGRRFGGRDHATVFHAVAAVESDIAEGRTGEGTRPWLVARIKERVGL
jgi:chromosomal replication initiator protein